jgi:alkanesulfonate monooxygenase
MARQPKAVGSQRLLAFAAQSGVHDKRLWMPIATATGAAGNTSALVGTPEQVCEALLDYYDAGVSTLLIRGFDPLQDAIEYGRELIPRRTALHSLDTAHMRQSRLRSCSW